MSPFQMFRWGTKKQPTEVSPKSGYSPQHYMRTIKIEDQAAAKDFPSSPRFNFASFDKFIKIGSGLSKSNFQGEEHSNPRNIQSCSITRPTDGGGQQYQASEPHRQSSGEKQDSSTQPPTSPLGNRKDDEPHKENHHLADRQGSWWERPHSGDHNNLVSRQRSLRERPPGRNNSLGERQGSLRERPPGRNNSLGERQGSLRERRPDHDDDHDLARHGSSDDLVVRDNIVEGDPSGVMIGKGNRGGRRTGGSVSGNRVLL